ncbi:MAG: L-lactate permease [Planctomycetota bacterium]|nr:L-lactate permease [Planctomycetota bacterium]
MTPWTQQYDPFGNIFLSAVFAALPIFVLLGLLAGFHVKAHYAALAGLAVSLVVAVGLFKMPTTLALTAAANGAAYGIFPIGWIVLTAIFTYDISVATGKFEILKRSVAGLADDRRIQVLLIAFSFGAFIEGAAGFGTPVAISSAMLIGLGFKPLPAAGLSLIGNTAPVAFGALGSPIIVLAKVTELPLDSLSMMVGRQLPVFSLLIPFWLIWVMAGWRGMIEVWPACLAAGLSFGIMQFLVSNYHGPWLVDVISAIVSIATLVGLLQVWQPKTTWRFADEPAAIDEVPPTLRETCIAWLPWLVLSVTVFLWGLPQAKSQLNAWSKRKPQAQQVGEKGLELDVPGLHLMVVRDQPIVAVPTPEKAIYELNWLSATGTALFLAGIMSGTLLGLSPATMASLFLGTLKRTTISLVTIAVMLALGYTTKYSGLDASMGLAFASTGLLFPFFSPLLGWLGVALTGSDTSSNVMFGNLQQITAERVGISPILAAAANSSGGVMGKMIDAQSLVVASVATNQRGQEGTILRYVFLHSIVLAIMVGAMVATQAYLLPQMIPVVPVR